MVGYDSSEKTKIKDQESYLLSVSLPDIDQSLWATLPRDLVLSIIASLSWDEICELSYNFRTLREVLRHHAYFVEYANARLLKPICILHLFERRKPQRTQPQYEAGEEVVFSSRYLAGLTSRYSVIAGDGHSSLDNLCNSKAKETTILSHNTLLGPSKNYTLDVSLESWVAGCFVLVKYRVLFSGASFVPVPGYVYHLRGAVKSGTVWAVINPATGAERQIDFPYHNLHLGASCCYNRFDDYQMYVSGIFKDGDSQYQILARSYDCDEDEHVAYMHGLPREEDLRRPANLERFYDRRSLGPRHAIFYLYKSRTKAWTKLLGSNIDSKANFIDPVLYKGAIHATLALELPCSNLVSYQVYYVGEAAGRKRWMPLAAPKPRGFLMFAHLFMFKGILMLAAGIPKQAQVWYQGRLSELRSVCIWKLDEELKTWVTVSCMPRSIFREARHEECCKYLWHTRRQCIGLRTSGDYVMIVGDSLDQGPGLDNVQLAPYGCVVMCNLAKCNWYLVHGKAPLSDKILQYELFEPRFDVEPQLSTDSTHWTDLPVRL